MRRSRLAGLLVTALLALLAPASATARDRDHDGLPDRWETRHGLSPKANSGSADPDRDRVDSLNEYRERTHPRDRDSDDDGRPDGREDRDRDTLDNAAEDQTGNDPRDRDSDDDGVTDGHEQAGVVASFDGERLVINLAGGGRVSGLVDEDTELMCESEKEAEAGWSKAGPGRAAGFVTEDGDPDDDGSGDEGDELEDDTGEDDAVDDDEDEAGGEEEDENACPFDRLEAGARVHEAELDIDADGAYFVAVELLS